MLFSYNVFVDWWNSTKTNGKNGEVNHVTLQQQTIRTIWRRRLP